MNIRRLKIEEALQTALLNALAKETGLPPERVASGIDSTDPTWKKGMKPGGGKYSQWIASQWRSFLKSHRSMNWNAKQANKNKSSNQQVARQFLDAARGDLEFMKSFFAPSETMSPFVNKLLQLYGKLVVSGNTEKYALPSDINKVPNMLVLHQHLQSVDPMDFLSKTEKEHGKVQSVPGSNIVYRDAENVVYEIQTAGAASMHGADTAWCFRSTATAIDYLAKGPLYVMYSKDGNLLSSVDLALDKKKNTIVPDMHKVIAFSWNGIADMDGDHVEVEDEEGNALANDLVGDDNSYWNIRTNKDSWVWKSELSEKEEIPPQLQIISNLAKGRDHGFTMWIHGDDPSIENFSKLGYPEDLGENGVVAPNYKDTKITPLELEVPAMPKRTDIPKLPKGVGVSKKAAKVNDAFKYTYLDEEEEFLSISFDHMEKRPRLHANYNYIKYNYEEAGFIKKFGDESIEIDASVGTDTEMEKQFWADIVRHLEGDILDENAYSGYEIELQPDAWDTSEFPDEVTNGFKYNLMIFASQETKIDVGDTSAEDLNDEELAKLTYLGIPLYRWYDAIGDGWTYDTLTSYLYSSRIDNTIEFYVGDDEEVNVYLSSARDFIEKTIPGEDPKLYKLRAFLKLKSPYDPDPNQLTLPYEEPENAG